jgi:hypothetical protein
VQLSAHDLTRYLVWMGVIALGAVVAVIDRRWIGRPVLGVLLVAGVAGGFMITKVSPFSFGGGDRYMQGVLLSAGAAMALIGYIFAAVWQLLCGRPDRPKADHDVHL